MRRSRSTLTQDLISHPFLMYAMITFRISIKKRLSVIPQVFFITVKSYHAYMLTTS